MSVSEHRKKLLDLMEDRSIAIVYAGRPTLANEDEYLPFVVNSQFFYLTDLQRAGMVLLLSKTGNVTREVLFIEEANPLTERWTGKMPTAEDVRLASGIEEILYLNDLPGTISRIMTRSRIDQAYFDTYRYDPDDLETYNARKAAEFSALYPAVQLHDLHTLVSILREAKDEEELYRIRSAIDITATGLERVLHALKPGMYEYQVQAVFEGSCMYEGAKTLAFPTISAGGKNACSMHYDTNDDVLADGDLILLDLGAKFGNYCSDITRTYPVNGRYSPRQRAVYDLVLKANRAVIEKAAPGVSLRDLQELTCSILGEGLVQLGLIHDSSEVRKYYMHSVSHPIGIDTHDVNMNESILQPGWVISDEPGLYIDEEGIGIRIEDDLLITETGCEVLSAAIPKDPDEIERLMREAKDQN